MAIKTAEELAAACLDVAKNYKTLYVMGCFGAPMTAGNKARYSMNHSYNKKAARKKMISAATADTFGFDCVCLIKVLLWGWSGDAGKTYGGAKYASNGVPDTNADGMIQRCREVSTDFSKIEAGEVVWMKGHIGVYIGDGLAVECTPAWKNCVQVTAVHNIGRKSGYNGRKWTSHGKLPYVSYTGKKEEKEAVAEPAATKVNVDYAKSFSKSKAGTYAVKSNIGLKLRAGASTKKAILETMPNGSSFRCYGFYTGSWLYGISASGKTGFCHKSYLVKK